MKFSKKSAPWLLIPPVMATLLILGPMSISGNGGGEGPATTDPAPAETAARPAGSTGSLVPKTPDMWRISGTLVGVLLLGAGVLVALKKLRGGATPTGTTALAVLRQTVRLSPKQALHAIEFDDRILLVGESDKGLSLIERGRLPDVADDEATVLARADDADDADDGAVPKNLLIPRPERPAAAPRRAAASKADQAIAKLNDFRSLLEKANR